LFQNDFAELSKSTIERFQQKGKNPFDFAEFFSLTICLFSKLTEKEPDLLNNDCVFFLKNPNSRKIH